MNRRYVKAGAAAAAAVLLAGGGATYAAFSDVETHEGNTVTAGVLDIEVTGLEEPITAGPVYPEDPPIMGRFDVTYVDQSGEIAGGEPPATVTVTMPDLTDTDDGCSSVGEARAEGVEFPEDAQGSAACADNGGELGQELQLSVYDCSSELGTFGQTLTTWHGSGPASLGTLQPGESLQACYSLYLPSSESNDLSQGDTSTFTLDVTGTQVVASGLAVSGPR